MIDLQLIDAVRSAWSRNTAASDNDWSTSHPAAGHCDVTALVIREFAGGDLRMAQVFRAGELSEHHFWNVLPGGSELDLTKSQFVRGESFSEATLMDDDFFASAGPINADLQNRLDAFRRAVNDHLDAARPPGVSQ